MSYRKIWEEKFGKIPKGMEIHHIDGNRKNNKIENLMCVSIEEHYRIHLEQGDYLACKIMAERMKLSEDERITIHKLAMKKRDQNGEKNPMYGKKHTEETKRKIGSKSVNRNWHRPNNYNGKNNPRAKPVIVDYNNKSIKYDCLKDFYSEYPILAYSTMKAIAQKNLINKKHNLRITYVENSKGV